MITAGLTVEDGLVTLCAETLDVLQRLDRLIVCRARELGAAAMQCPPLLRVAALERFDYFHNFPHLAHVVGQIDEQALSSLAGHSGRLHEIPAAQVTSVKYALPSSACFGVFCHHFDSTLASPRSVTVSATCFRQESGYKGLERLRAFTMREVVFIDTMELVRRQLEMWTTEVAQLAEIMDIPVSREIGADPFFDPRAGRSKMQALFPVKHEFVYRDSVAIASVNFHRNFFGERAAIRLADDRFAFSGCVAFGLERWLHAMLDRYSGDLSLVSRALDRAGRR